MSELRPCPFCGNKNPSLENKAGICQQRVVVISGLICGGWSVYSALHHHVRIKQQTLLSNHGTGGLGMSNTEKRNSLNLNDRIKVRLTPIGATIFYHQYDDLLKDHPQITSIKPKMPCIDKDGYTSFQLWCFIKLYGDFIGMGQELVIEDNRIYFETEKEGE